MASSKKKSMVVATADYKNPPFKGQPAFRLRRYPQTERQFFSVADGLPADRINGLAVSQNGLVWAATAAGMAVWNGKTWTKHGVAQGLPEGEIHLVYADKKGKVWAAQDDALYRFDGKVWQENLPERVLAMTEDESERLFAATAEQSLTLLHNDTWQEIALNRGWQVRDMAAYGHGNVLLATDDGLMTLYGKRRDWTEGRVDGPTRDGWKPVRAGTSDSISNDLRSIISDRWGHLWIATDRGVSVYDDTSNWFHMDGSYGLPYEDVQVVVEGPDGEKWFGTSGGAARLKDGVWKFFGARRWLPHNGVRAIAVAPDGTAWIGTEEGISRLTFREMTLEEKAEHYNKIVQQYHVRRGYVTGRHLQEPGKMEPGRVSISDNDGLWTALYVASQSYRFAVTAEEEARKAAQTHMDALLTLAEITGRKGFTARAIRHKTDPSFGDGHPEWHPATDSDYEWKGDTSSDEMVGHYYAYSVFFDLVANDEEKKRIRRVVGDITDHIIEHGYCLVDVDGRPTTWAVWGPDKLNLEDRWWPEKANNSLEILSFLKSAAHITGEERYEEAYRDLVSQHHYAMNTVQSSLNTGGRVSHIDDQLSFLSAISLLTYETDPQLRQFYLLALERHWQHERPERSPIWNAIYGALTGRDWDAEASVRSLAEIPLDLTHWETKNSHRADVKLDEELLEKGYEQLEEPLPFDERPLHKWDKNPYLLDGGSSLRVEDGSVYLHPYWFARYWGLIEETQ